MSAKIITYGSGITAGTTAIPDNTSEALDIEGTDANEYISIDTIDSNALISLKAADGSPGKAFEVRSDGAVGFNNSNSGWMTYEDTTATNPTVGPRKSDWDTGIGSAAADQLSLIAGGQEGIRVTEAGDAITEVAVKGRTVITADTSGTPDDLGDFDNYALVLQGSSNTDDETALLLSGSSNTYGGSAIVHKDTGAGGKGELNFYTKQSTAAEPPVKVMTLTDAGSVQTIGAISTALTGTFTATNGSAEITSGSSTAFTTELHVGSAIELFEGSTSRGVFTVSAIGSATALTLDSTVSGLSSSPKTGMTGKADGGELFAVKTGDSKTLFSVTGTGAIQVGSAAEDSNANNNIAIGDSDALDTIEQSGTNGIKNTIIGHADDNYKLTTGYGNVFIGYDCGTDVTTGNQCVAIGDIAMGAAQAGANLTTAVGRKAGYSAGNTGTYVGAYAGEAVTGYSNVAVGYGAMGLNGPDQGVAIGRSAHANCTGDNNVAIGAYSLDQSGSAGNSVAVGYNALTAATGDYNIAVGNQAGDGVGSGGGNLLLGYQADCDASANYQIAIGFQVSTSAVSTAAIGDATRTATLNFGAAGQSWSTTSDERIKENVQDSKLGLDFINALRPITYTEINPQDWPEDIRPHVYFDREKTRTNEDGTKETYIEPAKEREATSTAVVDGLMAQEVKAAADAEGVSFSGWEQQPDGLQRLQYEKFVLPLIVACQDLSAQVTALTARVAELEAGD